MEEAFQVCDAVLIMHKGVKVMEGSPRELVWTRIERFVLELREHGSALPELPVDGSVRMEAARGGARYYANQNGALQALAARMGADQYHIRETNLEDLFLHATGSSLDG
jgi:lipooligosaccharide transport system ATP-binding protein